MNGAPGSDKTDVALEVARLLHVDQFISTRIFVDYLGLDTPNLKETYDMNSFLETVKQFENPFLNLIQKSHQKGFSIMVEGIHVTPQLFEKIPTSEKFGFYLAPYSLDEQVGRLMSRYEKRKILPVLKSRMNGIREIDQYLRNECEKNKQMNIISFPTTEQKVQAVLSQIR